jgi:hypothetical protein
MLKRLLILAFAGLLSPAQAAGTISLSLSQQFDQFGNVLAGCRLNIIRAGTTSTPQDSFKDSALTIKHPNPILCNAAGRLPQFFLADGSIKVRLTDSRGVNQDLPGATASGLDGILVVGPSGGGGGGSTVDPTTIIATGDYKLRHGTGTLTGFVRANGRTIGSATSGATERANADCEALFEYLWDTDPNLTVSTGRGASSAADWAANKTIVVPDWRGRVPAGMDDMGNSAAGRLTATYFGTAATVLGAAGGAESHTLALANLPTGITSANTGSIALSVNTADNVNHSGGAISSAQAGGAQAAFSIAGSTTGLLNSTGIIVTGGAVVTSNNTSGTAHATTMSAIAITVYQKL